MSHVTHYGPVREGDWYGALCRVKPTTGDAVMMSTHKPMTNCQECWRILAERRRASNTSSGQS